MSEHIERIEDFVSQVKQSKQCFVLSSENGLLIAPSEFQEERDVLLLWASSDAAKHQCSGEWRGFNVIELELDDLTDLLPDLHDDELLVGLDLSDEQIAIEIEANALLDDLTQ
ncbi:DUF2750 domain-containing protein [Pseudoalteromonas sp. G4]|uniref:DUF2750 domain-containing protein n=1 Tax=Pseudoalteromonas sp. G4 TaxID=2992761 RepID=UPI00237E087D|nr:DUF2750 domain-containing protein [Pseudoalteromonas sp. G4]MDE3273069.1 DUF2750 domain-containing protein [Pseudoalteromonas sp. G4]